MGDDWLFDDRAIVVLVAENGVGVHRGAGGAGDLIIDGGLVGAIDAGRANNGVIDLAADGAIGLGLSASLAFAQEPLVVTDADVALGGFSGGAGLAGLNSD